MPNQSANQSRSTRNSTHGVWSDATTTQPWHTFEDVLSGLHQDGILLHPHQLAEFFLMHGLPVDLRYVPDRLQKKAIFINEHYHGDLAQLEAIEQYPWCSYSLV